MFASANYPKCGCPFGPFGGLCGLFKHPASLLLPADLALEAFSGLDKGSGLRAPRNRRPDVPGATAQLPRVPADARSDAQGSAAWRQPLSRKRESPH